ncbi:hypothetical protein CDV31_016268 [Fusarium ambrosium]|uniref:Uncharacterized protein n=1 Tax=Fusarium ambrosium TaxID=131363 RepID=A0A428SC62_9HYPO|nr:hypothetical protein CDV31_016268 [Fusarium ambrosium]
MAMASSKSIVNIQPEDYLENLQNLRLVNKRTCVLVSPLMFRHITYSSYTIGNVAKIAASAYASCVRHIDIDGIDADERGTETAAFINNARSNPLAGFSRLESITVDFIELPAINRKTHKAMIEAVACSLHSAGLHLKELEIHVPLAHDLNYFFGTGSTLNSPISSNTIFQNLQYLHIGVDLFNDETLEAHVGDLHRRFDANITKLSRLAKNVKFLEISGCSETKIEDCVLTESPYLQSLTVLHISLPATALCRNIGRSAESLEENFLEAVHLTSGYWEDVIRKAMEPSRRIRCFFSSCSYAGHHETATAGIEERSADNDKIFRDYAYDIEATRRRDIDALKDLYET